VTLSPLFLGIFSFYNFYYKREFTRPTHEMFRNIRFLQMFMGLTSDTVTLAYEVIEDLIYWKQPDKAVALLREGVKVPLALGLLMYVASLRYVIVGGIWAVALANSPFFLSLFHIIFEKVTTLSFLILIDH